jgi:hypothetical protein
MVTALKNSAKTFATNTQNQEPKRLSKVGQWMRDNPGGIFIVKDRRAVNK